MLWEELGGSREGWRGGDIHQGVRRDGGFRTLPGWVPPVGSWNSPSVGNTTWDVPPHHSVRVERGRMHVLQGCWGSVPEPNLRVDQSTMELVGYWISRKEMRDIYHSMYLLRRFPGSPSCGERQRRKTIQDILSSLMVRLQRQTYPATTGDPGPQEGECVGLDWQGSYEVALWVACQRTLETAEALQWPWEA